MSNTTLTPGLHWAHPSVYMYVHMYVTMSSRFLYKVYTITPVQCHTPVAASLHMTLVDCKEWTTYNYHTSVVRIVQNLRICK